MRSLMKIIFGERLSLRDRFAIAAIEGIMANDLAVSRMRQAAQENMISPDVMAATCAYLVADAMVLERAK